jgi:hypothetical protein
MWLPRVTRSATQLQQPVKRQDVDTEMLMSASMPWTGLLSADAEVQQTASSAHLLHELDDKFVALDRWILCCKVVEPLAHNEVCLPQLEQDVLDRFAGQDLSHCYCSVALEPLLVPSHVLLAPILAV